MISLGQSWSVLVSLGQSWSVLVRLGQSWSVLVSLGQSWSVLVSFGQPWSVLVSLGLSSSGLVRIEGFRAILNTQTEWSMDGIGIGMGYLQTGPFLDHLAVIINKQKMISPMIL